MLTNTGVLILAGGRSSRMDFPKPWLKYDDENDYLEHLVNLYLNAGIDDIAVVINSNFCTEAWHGKIADLRTVATVIKNEHPEFGRLHSIALGLKAILADHVFIQNVDSPYIGAELIHEMEREKLKYGTAIPMVNGRKGHPVLIGPEVKKSLSKEHPDKETLKNVLNNFEQKLVETADEAILINVNTRSQYQQYSGRYIQ